MDATGVRDSVDVSIRPGGVAPAAMPAEHLAVDTTAPLISVVTPSFNQGRFIERCICGVLQQNYPNFEHIVCDNCSTDETLDILRRYPHLDCVSEPDAGQSDALNKAIRRSRGEIIAWINADDYYEPGTFSLAARELVRDAGVMAIVGRVHLVDEQGRIKRTTTPRLDGLDSMLAFWDDGYGICQPGVMFRREVVERVGEFRTDLHFAMDYDFWLRMVQRRLPIKIVDQVLARYVFQPESKSSSAYFGRGFNEELARVSRQYWGPPWTPRHWRLARGCRRFVTRQLVNAVIKTHERQERVDWRSLWRLLLLRPAGLLHRHLLAVFAERAIGTTRWDAVKRRLGMGYALSHAERIGKGRIAGHLTIQIQVNSPLDAPGGGAVHARGLANALRQMGVNVSVLCTGWSGDCDSGELGTIMARRPTNLHLLWRWPPLGTLPFWVRTIRKNSAGVGVFVALSAEMAVASRLARPDLPVVYCPAALNGCEYPAARLTSVQRCEQRAFRGASAILYPAQATRDAAERLYGLLPGISAVCPLGVESTHTHVSTDVRRERGIPPDAFVLLTVGTINGNKGQVAIAQALANAAPNDWCWVIVGDGPDRTALETQLRGTRLAARTALTGNRADMSRWYAAADVLVCASRCETFGLACAEALAAGLPVILPANRPGFTLSPLAEIVTTHQLGCTFLREQPETLVNVLRELAADPDELARMGSRAREFARIHFSWDRYAECVLEMAGGGRQAGSVTGMPSTGRDS